MKLFTSGVFFPLKGLYEYVKPAWQTRARPDVGDYDIKKFGSTSPPRPKDPQINPPKLSGEDKKEDANTPRYINIGVGRGGGWFTVSG